MTFNYGRKIYDTESMEYIDSKLFCDTDDCVYCFEKIYRAEDGAYFLHVQKIRYIDYLDGNGDLASLLRDEIFPMTDVEAARRVALWECE